MNDDVHLLAAAYALDALEPAERRRYEAHYPDCEICRNEVAGFRATAALLAESVSVEPPPEVKDRVMERVRATRQLPPAVVALRRHDGRLIVAAAAAVALVVGVVVGALAFGVSDDDGGDGGEVAELAEVLAAPDAVTTQLAPTVADAAGDATVRVVWSARLDAAVVVGGGLTVPGPDLVYALWSLTGDEVRPAGLFEPTAGGAVASVLEVALEDSEGWGVTIEPEGGSPQPTGDILFAAEI